MNRRILISWAAVIAAILFASCASAQRSRLQNVTSDYNLSRRDAAATIVLANSLHLSEREIVNSARDCGKGVFDVAPAFVLANSQGIGVDRVWRQRDGRKWLDYARDLRMDMRDFNRLDVREDDFDRMMWVNLLDRSYGCRPSLWDDMRGRGLSPADALVAIVLADGDRYYCDQIYDQYRQDHYDWAPVFTWCLGLDVVYGYGPYPYYWPYVGGFGFWGGFDFGFGPGFGGRDRDRHDRGDHGGRGDRGGHGLSSRSGGGSREPGLYDSQAWGERSSRYASGGRGTGRSGSSFGAGRSGDSARSAGGNRSGGHSFSGGSRGGGGGHGGGGSFSGGGHGGGRH